MVKFNKFLSYKRRSIWKGANLLVFSRDYFKSNKIYNKNFCIGFFELGETFKIYNGKFFVSLRLRFKSLGFKFGQLLLTKKFGVHLRDKKKKKKK